MKFKETREQVLARHGFIKTGAPVNPGRTAAYKNAAGDTVNVFINPEEWEFISADGKRKPAPATGAARLNRYLTAGRY